MNKERSQSAPYNLTVAIATVVTMCILASMLEKMQQMHHPLNSYAETEPSSPSTTTTKSLFKRMAQCIPINFFGSFGPSNFSHSHAFNLSILSLPLTAAVKRVSPPETAFSPTRRASGNMHESSCS